MMVARGIMRPKSNEAIDSSHREVYPGALKDGGLSSLDLVKLLYVVAREREDPRMMVHVEWARKRLRAVLFPLPAPLASSFPPRPLLAGYPLIEEIDRTGSFQALVDLLYATAELGLPSVKRIALVSSPRHREEAAAGLEPCIGCILDCLRRSFILQNPNNLTTTMVCLAVLKARPTDEWTRSFFELGVKRLAPGYRPQELANVLTAASFLGLDLGTDVLAAILKRVEGFDLVEVAMFLRKLEQAPSSSAKGRGAGGDWLTELRQVSKKNLVAKAELRR